MLKVLYQEIGTKFGLKGKVMKTLMLIFFISLFRPANAQFLTNYEIFCDNTQRIVKILRDNKLTLSWTGNHLTDGTAHSLWIDRSSGSWTLLKMTTEVSCIMGIGQDSKSNYNNFKETKQGPK